MSANFKPFAHRVASSALALLLLAGCSRAGGRSYTATSAGMAPTIPMGAEFRVRDRADGELIERGALVVYRQGGSLHVSRAVAISGDKIEIVNRVVKVNDSAIGEPYVLHTDKRVIPPGAAVHESLRYRDNLPARTLGPGEVFLLGDNREQAVDSRILGPFHQSVVVGYVVPDR